MTGVVEGAGSDLVVVSGDKEFAGLSLDLLILLQSDDCCHSGEHWDVCSQQTQPQSQFNAAKLSYKLDALAISVAAAGGQPPSFCKYT